MSRSESPSIRHAQIQARVLLKDLQSNDAERQSAAAERLRVLQTFRERSAQQIIAERGNVRLKHARQVVALELGHVSWDALLAADGEDAGMAQVVANVKEHADRNVYIATVPVDSSFQYEVEVSPDFIAGVYDTGTADPQQARRGRARLEKALTDAGLYVVKSPAAWADYLYNLRLDLGTVRDDADPDRDRQRPADGFEYVQAFTYDDDHIFEVNFNAVEWFQKAHDDEIIELAGCGWGGDMPADGVAQYFDNWETNRKIAAMFVFVAEKDDIGYECHVRKASAMRWLWRHRPALAERIATDEDLQSEGWWSARFDD